VFCPKIFLTILISFLVRKILEYLAFLIKNVVKTRFHDKMKERLFKKKKIIFFKSGGIYLFIFIDTIGFDL
jgi:hypothetical protein